MTQIDPCLTERQQYSLKHIRACDAAGQPSVEYARERFSAPTVSEWARHQNPSLLDSTFNYLP